LTIIRAFTKEVAALQLARCVCVHVDKRGKGAGYDVFEHAWRALIQRFSNTLVYGNFPRGAGTEERGMLFPDETDQVKLKRLVGRMRRHNPIPNQARFGGDSETCRSTASSSTRAPTCEGPVARTTSGGLVRYF